MRLVEKSCACGNVTCTGCLTGSRGNGNADYEERVRAIGGDLKPQKERVEAVVFLPGQV